MRFSLKSTLLALSSYALLAGALPYYSQQAVERHLADSLSKRTVSYSVVAVDGGPSSAEPTQTKTEQTTKTVTKPAKTLPPATETIVSTIVMTESNKETTVPITNTQCPACPSATPDAAAPPSTSAPSLAEATTTATAQDTVTRDVVIPGEDITVATAQPTSTTTYDDGFYHTTWSIYNGSPTASSSTSSSSSSEALPALPTTSDSPAELT